MKYPVSVKSLLVIVITIFIIPLWIWTQPAGQGQPDEQGGRRPQGPPPPEAIEACESKSEGDTCEVNTPHGTLNGTCTTIENQSACVPEGGPGGQTKQGAPGGGQKELTEPSQEAINACKDKSKNDTCEFKNASDEEKGVCATIEEQLTCVIDCSGKSMGDSCQYVGANGIMPGTCMLSLGKLNCFLTLQRKSRGRRGGQEGQGGPGGQGGQGGPGKEGESDRQQGGLGDEQGRPEGQGGPPPGQGGPPPQN